MFLVGIEMDRMRDSLSLLDLMQEMNERRKVDIDRYKEERDEREGNAG
jgi:hypothetical protein